MLRTLCAPKTFKKSTPNIKLRQEAKTKNRYEEDCELTAATIVIQVKITPGLKVFIKK